MKFHRFFRFLFSFSFYFSPLCGLSLLSLASHLLLVLFLLILGSLHLRIFFCNDLHSSVSARLPSGSLVYLGLASYSAFSFCITLHAHLEHILLSPTRYAAAFFLFCRYHDVSLDRNVRLQSSFWQSKVLDVKRSYRKIVCRYQPRCRASSLLQASARLSLPPTCTRPSASFAFLSSFALARRLAFFFCVLVICTPSAVSS
jgi:hypothetical protein